MKCSKSKATWKVIANDLPLGIDRAGRPGERGIAVQPRRRRPVGQGARDRRGAVRVQAQPGEERGLADGRRALLRRPPLLAGTRRLPRLRSLLGVRGRPHQRRKLRAQRQLDGTFGPEVAFSKAGAYANESPRSGESQFFGHVDLGEDDVFTVSLRNANGVTVFSKVLTPEN